MFSSPRTANPLPVAELAGYSPRYPGYAIIERDARLATAAPCGICGGAMLYLPFVNKAGGYRAFSVCPKCGAAIEL